MSKGICIEKHILNDEEISILSKSLKEKLTNRRNKLEKVNKGIENIFNSIMNDIVLC